MVPFACYTCYNSCLIPEMLLLLGSSSISAFKKEALLHKIQPLCPRISSVDAIWVHLVQSKSLEREKELKDTSGVISAVLNRLLAYGDNIAFAGTTAAILAVANVAFVLPRHGSISPWSSKATDIARLCRLDNHVERLERGTAFVFTASDGQADY
jgi:phosphoribosylformylglycinamidine synthase